MLFVLTSPSLSVTSLHKIDIDVDKFSDSRQAFYEAVLLITQQAHNVKMTSYQRRCDVITSHRR